MDRLYKIEYKTMLKDIVMMFVLLLVYSGLHNNLILTCKGVKSFKGLKEACKY